jgi:cystathionine beta-lyase
LNAFVTVMLKGREPPFGNSWRSSRRIFVTEDSFAEDHFETLLAHDGALDDYGSVSPAIHQTSLFAFDSYEAMKAAFAGESRHPIYSRGISPTVQAFERKLARLEGAEAAKAFSSGMGAISTTVLAHVRAGDRIVCIRNVYPDAYKLFTQFLPRFDVHVDFVDGTDHDTVIQQLDGAKLLYLESPTSLLFELQDLEALTRAAKERGVITIADNSWATPMFQQPLRLGVDLVVHSASKYLSGHSDVVAGVVAGAREAIERLSRLEYSVLGAKLSPFEGWLLLRGLRTLPLRMERHHASACAVAAFLQHHPAVARVHHPALPTHPQHALFRKQFTGACGLFSFELHDVAEVDVARFVNALRLFRIGVSWGGYESLVYPAAIGYAAGGPSNAVRDFAVPKNLVRLHVGLEHPDDLIADVEQALSALEGGKRTEQNGSTSLR